LLFNIRVF